MKLEKQHIVDYYDSNEIDYRWIWNLDESLAQHLGYWDDTTKTLPQALRKENEILVSRAYIRSRILF